ncbi:DUF4197 domain-containing protein [Chitinophagaceae bacterium LWZ2-11]
MKRVKFFLVACSFIMFSGCDVVKQAASLLIPSQADMAGGLKDALNQGLFKGFDAFSNPNNNALVQFAFPGDAAKIQSTLSKLGLDKAVNQVTSKFTNAMCQSVLAAKPIFISSIKNMSFTDAASILITNNQHAATDYLKTNTTSQLMVAFRPIVDSTIKLNGADKDWSKIAATYNAIPFINKPVETSLTDFVAARAIDIMFNSISNEEVNVRTKLEARSTDLMKRVFGYADQELQKKNAKQ